MKEANIKIRLLDDTYVFVIILIDLNLHTETNYFWNKEGDLSNHILFKYNHVFIYPKIHNYSTIDTKDIKL